jgi:hypothetical protein
VEKETRKQGTREQGGGVRTLVRLYAQRSLIAYTPARHAHNGGMRGPGVLGLGLARLKEVWAWVELWLEMCTIEPPWPRSIMPLATTYSGPAPGLGS